MSIFHISTFLMKHLLLSMIHCRQLYSVKNFQPCLRLHLSRFHQLNIVHEVSYQREDKALGFQDVWTMLTDLRIELLCLIFFSIFQLVAIFKPFIFEAEVNSQASRGERQRLHQKPLRAKWTPKPLPLYLIDATAKDGIESS